MLNVSQEIKQFIKQGRLAQTGVTETMMLMVIELNGEDPITQIDISEQMGISLSTTNRTIKKLMDLHMIEKVGKFKPVKYVLTGHQPEIIDKDMTAKDFITRYCELYKETYGVEYNPSWGRAVSIVNGKLIGNFTDDQLETILTVTFRDYDKRWMTTQYKRPTLGAICTWLCNEALVVGTQEDHQDKKIQDASEEDLAKYFTNTSF